MTGLVKTVCNLSKSFDLKKPFSLDQTGRPSHISRGYQSDTDSTHEEERPFQKKERQKRERSRSRERNSELTLAPPDQGAQRRKAREEATPKVHFATPTKGVLKQPTGWGSRGAAAEETDTEPGRLAQRASRSDDVSQIPGRQAPRPGQQPTQYSRLGPPDGTEITPDNVNELEPDRIPFATRTRIVAAVHDAHPDLFKRPNDEKVCMRATPGFIYEAGCQFGNRCRFSHDVQLPKWGSRQRAQFWRQHGVTRFESGQATKRSRGEPERAPTNDRHKE